MVLAADRRARLDRVLGRLRMPAAEPVPLASDSNDVWRIGPLVLRVCWRGDLERFAREAAVTAALPPEVPYPEVLDAGSADGLAWQVTRAIPGTPLATCWPQLSDRQRRDAIHQIGRALAALHEHQFPTDVCAALADRRTGGTTPAALIGADINPLPVQRTLRLVDHLRDLPYVDPSLVDDVVALLYDLAHADPFTGPDVRGCVHGDAHPTNALWHDGRLAALLDFEWVRMGPPDLDIEPYLRADIGVEADRRAILEWLAEGHPAAFATPVLDARLRLYQLAHAARQVLIHPPDRPSQHLPPDHPFRFLHRVVTAADHLASL